MKPIQVGLLGIGTVGGGTFEVLRRNAEEIRRRAGREIRITMVADLDVERARRIVGDHARIVADAREVIRQISTSDVRTRVATALLKLAERLGDADEQGILIRAPLSRQDLAAMVGATPETVSRVMADLKREGLIDTGRQWVRVLDSEALRAIDA